MERFEHGVCALGYSVSDYILERPNIGKQIDSLSTIYIAFLFYGTKCEYIIINKLIFWRW